MSLIGEFDLQEPDYDMTEEEKMNDQQYQRISAIKVKMEELKNIRKKIQIHNSSKYVDSNLAKKLAFNIHYKNSESYGCGRIIEKLLNKDITIENILEFTEFNNIWEDDLKKLVKEESLIEADLRKLLDLKLNNYTVLKLEEKGN